MTTKRPTPDDLLRQVQKQEEFERRGRLKVFLGYASGVGKSFRMLDEGRRRRERGEDVAVGAVQPGASPEIAGCLEHLEVIPLKVMNDTAVMDVPAILQRHPGVCLVDGLAYNNPPGSRNSSRWQDVRDLLNAGVNVITSINIQYIDEFRERIEKLTGKHVTQTVPQAFLYTADEIVVVDATPEATLAHTTRTEDATRGARKLSELREIALLLTADVVDHQLEAYLERSGISQGFGTEERILVCITPYANAQAMIESGRRNADRFHGDLIVTYVRQPDLTADDQAALDRNLAIARAVKAEISILDGEDPIDAILTSARGRGITQIFVGHSHQEKWWQRLTGSRVDRLIRGAEGIDIRVFPH